MPSERPRQDDCERQASPRLAVKVFQAPADIAMVVERLQIVTWDLAEGASRSLSMLGHAGVHLVFQPDASRVTGVVDTIRSVMLGNRGRLLGVSIKPGAFPLLAPLPMYQLTNQSVPLMAVLGIDVPSVERLLIDAEPETCIDRVVNLLREGISGRDDDALLANEIVQEICANPATTLAQLASTAGVSLRTLERLFRQYVGVAPKTVKKQCRVRLASDRIRVTPRYAGADLAAELGYCDQAHFIKEFKQMVGVTPGKYAKRHRTSKCGSSAIQRATRQQD